MKIAVTFILLLLYMFSLPGQCPDRDFLWHRIIFLRDSSTIEPVKQLDELLGYQQKISECNYRDDSIHALLLQRIGWLYTKKNDFFNGIQYTQKSIALVDAQRNNPGINPAIAIKCFWNLHLMYDSLKLETKKIEAVDSCISRAIHLGTGYDYALPALGMIIPRLFIIGDYYRCVTYAILAESITRQTSGSTAEAEESSFGYFAWKINALIFLNRREEAGKLVTDKIRFALTNRKEHLMGALYSLYATVLMEKQPQEAIGYFEKSFRHNLHSGNRANCAEALNNIGYTYAINLHQPATAIPYHTRALKFADANESLNIFDNIANIYVQAGKYDSAFLYFQKAFDQLQPGFTEANLLKNDKELPGITEYITGMVLDKAAAWLKKYKTTGEKAALGEAIRIYQLTDRYFDKLKSAQGEIQSRLFWKTNNRRLYEQAIEACYESGDLEKAFYFFEKSRSVLLNEQIMEQRRMEDRDIAKQAQLKKNIIDIERSIANTPPSSKEYLNLQQLLFTNKQELDALIRNINQLRPGYAQHSSDTATLSLEMVRKRILNQDKSLLEIFNGDSAVYILSVTPGQNSLSRHKSGLYDSLTTRFISFIGRPEILNKDFTGFANTAHRLYELIFQNIVPAAGGSLIISPDGKSFPFEALVTNTDYRQPDYLLNHYATSYTYSAKYLVNEYVANKKNRNDVLGMAPVKYSKEMGMADLPGSDGSLAQIKKRFAGVSNYVFGNATRNNFLQHFADYSIIQLYTHAADSSINNDPVIYFADSALYLSDLITDRKPLTQLVVLSACETANGKFYQGEGIFSFNRGFAALGIPAAISNLWSVDNESTYRITELFYKHLAAGLTTDMALQKAKLEFISNSPSKEKKLPYFWAGCILTGKVDTIKGVQAVPWKEIILLVAGLILIAFLLKRLLFKAKRL